MPAPQSFPAGMFCDDDKVDPSPNETGPKSPHISKRWNGELFGVGCGIFPVIAESEGVCLPALLL